MRFFIVLFCVISLSLKGQNQRVVPIETFPVNATVLSTLQGLDDRAVLRVDKIEPNSYGIETGDTLICTFFWSIHPVKDKLADFPGLGAGDEISTRMGAQWSKIGQRWQFTAYHYKNRSRNQKQKAKAESRAAP